MTEETRPPLGRIADRLLMFAMSSSAPAFGLIGSGCPDPKSGIQKCLFVPIPMSGEIEYDEARALGLWVSMCHFFTEEGKETFGPTDADQAWFALVEATLSFVRAHNADMRNRVEEREEDLHWAEVCIQHAEELLERSL